MTKCIVCGKKREIRINNAGTNLCISCYEKTEESKRFSKLVKEVYGV